MSKEAQSPREQVSGREHQRPDRKERGEIFAEAPIPKFDRPQFRPDPTIQEAPGGQETAQNLLDALDKQSSEQHSSPTNENPKQGPAQKPPLSEK